MIQHIESKHKDAVGSDECNDEQDMANGDVKNEEGVVECQLCDFISSEAELTEHFLTCHVIC